MTYLNNYMREQHIGSTQRAASQGHTLGTVVDVNDPQQRGRVRVMCPSLGDDPEPSTMDVGDLPWAMVATPFGGFVDQGFRANGSKINDETAYGMFGVPKVGARALVTILDGNYSLRVVVGFVFDLGGVNTLPFGRYQADGGSITGPLAVGGKAIEPLFSNGKSAFSNRIFSGGDPHGSAEWMSRGADKTAAAHGPNTKREGQLENDDLEVKVTGLDGKVRTHSQGYGSDRLGAISEMSGERDHSKDPQTYCWVTPGFHGISMDDREGNTRMRFRTSTGHQILLDDTNERIYISTNKGNSWVEMDTCGNIDIHSETRLSIHAAKDINLTAGESIRLSAKELHFKASGEARITAVGDIGVHSNGSVRVGATVDTLLQAGAALHLKSGTTMHVLATTSLHHTAGDSIFNTTGSTIETSAGGDIINNAPTIHNNSGPQAAPAILAKDAAEQPAKHTNRVPQHEPWPRMMADKTRVDMIAESALPPTDGSKWTSPPIVVDGTDLADTEHKDYGSPQIGRVDNGVAYVRNPQWRR